MRTGSRFLLINLLVTLVASSFIKRVGFVITALLMLAALLPPIALAAPAAPSNLQASMAAGPPIGAALTWTDNSANEVGFKVERAIGGGAFTNITGLGLPQNSVAFTDTTVTAGVTYSYRVMSFDLTGDSAPSNTATILAIVTAAPTVLTATQQAGPPQTVTLSWTDNSNNEIGFRIERADNAGFTINVVPNVRVANVAAAPVTFVDPDVMPGSTYFYRVASLSPFGASANSNTATITVTAAAGMQAGPVVPIAGFPAPNGFPLYYQDTLGRKLELLPIGPVNFADPVIAGNAYSAALGFGTEAFYYLASADELDIGAGPGIFKFAIEAVFGSPDGSAAPSQEAVMARTRIRFDVPVNGDYTVQTPYGTRTFTSVVAGVPGFDVNFTEDVGAIPRIFSGPNSPIQPQDPVLNPNPITVFLRPVTSQLGDGIFGDGITPTAVTDGPQGNSVTITGPGINTASSTWLINGRLSGGMALVPSFTKSLVPTSGLVPVVVNFTDTSTNPTTWTWDFGDGTTSTLQNPVHTYTTSGNFIVKLTASNAGSSASTSQMISTFGIPLAPSGVAGETTSINQVTVTFTDNSTDELAFRVERADNALFTVGLTSFNVDAAPGAANTLNLVDNTVVQGNSYFYRVFAVNVVGDSPSSNTAQVIVGGGPTSPAAPGTLAATSVTPNQVVLSWVDSDNLETGFRIERATGAGPFAVLTSLPVDSISFADTTVAPNTSYQYRVMAFNVVGVSLPSNVFMVTTPGVPTAVGGLITSNTTWTAANSPYVVTSSVLVNAGARLTVEPGVTVKFNSGKGLQIDGELVARGTEASPILFTSNQVTPAPGNWVNILFSDSSVDAQYDGAGNYLSGSILQYSTVEYGGGGDSPTVKMVGSSPLIYQSTIRNNSSAGILVQSGSPRISHSTISNNVAGYALDFQGGGVYVSSGAVTLTNSAISNNSAYIGGGLHIRNGALTLNNNTITGNSAGWGGGGISFGGGTVTASDNTITGNSAGSHGGAIFFSSNMSFVNLTRNRITGNSSPDGIYVIWQPTINNNEIHDNGTYDLYNANGQGSPVVDATNNWWGTANEAVIQAKIYDWFQNASRGIVNYSPFLTSSPFGPSGAISGHVYQAGTTDPIEGAEVIVYKGILNQVGSDVTDTAGYYQVAGLPSGEYAVQANAAGYAAEWYQDSFRVEGARPVSVDAPGDTPDIDFTLEPGSAISGHVYQQGTTTGIEGVLVIVSQGPGGGFAWALSAPDGSYTTPGLPAGQYGLWALAQSYAGEWYQESYSMANATPVPVTLAGNTLGIIFTLEPGSSISGQAKRSDDQSAIEGAQIAVFGSDGTPYALAWSEADGSYTTTGLLDGEYSVLAQAAGYVPEWYDGVYNVSDATVLTITGDRSGIDLLMEEGGAIEGTVVSTATGEGIAGAKVGVFDYGSLSGNWVGRGGATTDSQGRYVTSPLPAGSYAVRVQAAGFITEFYDNAYSTDQAAEVILGDGEHKAGINFSLEAAGSISGRVLDQTTGGLVEDAGVGSIDLDAGWHKFVYRFDEGWGASIARAAFKATGDAAWRWFSTSELEIRTAPNPAAQSGITLATRKNTWGDSHPSDHWALVRCVDYDSVEDPGWSGQSVVSVINQNENIHGNDDYFTSRYEAYFYVNTAGTWWFATDSDDASDIEVDGQVVAYWYNGHPAAGRWEHKAVVNIWDYDSDKHIKGLPTEPDGSYTIGDLPAGTYRIDGGAPGYFGASAVVTVAQGESKTGVDIGLEPSGSISGTVTSQATGLPLASISLDAGRTDGPGGAGATTDQNGNYTITGLAYGQYKVTAPAKSRWGSGDDGYILQYFNNKTSSASADMVTIAAGSADATGINFALAQGGSISGHVTDEGGNALANADVWADYWAGGTASKTSTDAHGNYLIIGLATGDYRVQAQAAGKVRKYYNNTFDYQQATPVHVTPPNATPNINFSLESGGTISGTVTSLSTGLPLANIGVGASRMDGPGGGGATTNSSGVYTITGLPFGQYKVNAPTGKGSGDAGYVRVYYNGKPDSNGADLVAITGAAPNTTGINLNLAQGGSISGHVADELGNPLANADVWADYWAGGNAGGTKTDALGNYVIVGLGTGDYKVGARSAGRVQKNYNNTLDYSSATAVHVTAPNNTHNIDFSLEPGGTISGTITSQATGLSLANIGVNAKRTDGPGGGGATTDSNGSYTIGNLPFGTFNVNAPTGKGSGDAGYMRVYYNGKPDSNSADLVAITGVAPNATGINLALAQGGSISGHVYEADGVIPIPGASVGIQDFNTNAGFPGATTQADGSFTIPGLPAGSYRINAWASNHVRKWYPNTLWSNEATPVVVVVPNVTPNINFSLEAGGTISGTITSQATGLPLANVSVDASRTDGPGGGGAKTNASGLYTVTGLPFGQYKVNSPSSKRSGSGDDGYMKEYYNNRSDSGTADLVTISAISVNATGVDFALAQGGSISGTVTDEIGNPLANADVWADYWTGGNFGGTKTDANGNYTIVGLGTGDYKVGAKSAGRVQEFYDSTFDYNAATPVHVTVPGNTPNINFALDLGGTISGTITSRATGLPLANISVDAWLTDKSAGAGTTTNVGGVYTITGLPFGQYKVQSPKGWGSGDNGYIREYFNNQPGWDNADLVTISAASPNTTGINFALDLGGTISGTITSQATGLPLANVSVDASRTDGPGGGGAKTNASGLYTVTGLPFGQYKVNSPSSKRSGSGDDGYMKEYYNNRSDSGTADLVTISAISVNATGVDFALAQGGSISGTVLDQDTGLPVEDASYGSVDLSAGWHKLVYRQEESGGGQTSRAAFKAPGDAEWRWFSTTEMEIRTAPDQAAPSGITLVTGKKNSAGHALNHAGLVWLVDVDSTPDAGWYGESVVSVINQNENVHGNDDNYTSRYEAYFYATADGTWWFSTDSDDASEIEIDDQVVAYWYNGHGSAGRWEHKAWVSIQDFSTGAYVFGKIAAADGTYRLGPFPSGSYRVQTMAPGYGTEYYQESSTHAGATAVTVSAPAETTGINLTLDRATGSISGTVTYSGAIEGSHNIYVVARSPGSPSYSTLLTSQSGAYTIPEVPDGAYLVEAFLDVDDNLTISPGDRIGFYPDPVSVSGGPVSDVDIYINDMPQGVIVGTVRLQGRQNTSESWTWADAWVWIDDGTQTFGTVPFPDGTFVVAGPVGVYDVYVEMPGYLSALRSGVTLDDITLYVPGQQIPQLPSLMLLGGDADFNGQVDIGDLLMIAAGFGGHPTPGYDGDVNGDGAVNIADLVLAGMNFGKTETLWP